MARLSCGQSEAVTCHTSEGRPGCSCRVAGAFEESNHRQRLSPEGAAARGLRARRVSSVLRPCEPAFTSGGGSCLWCDCDLCIS